MELFQERGPIHSRVWEWSCLTHRNKLSEKTHILTNDFHGKGCPRGEQQGEGTQENYSAMWLPVLGFMVMGLIAGLCLVSHLAWPIFGLTQYPSRLYVHLSAKVNSRGKRVKQYYGLESPSSIWWILNYSSSLWWQHHIPYQNLLFWDNMCKWLSSCLVKAGGFGQQFPNWNLPRGHMLQSEK